VLLLRARHDNDLVGRADLVPLVNPSENLRIGEFRRFGHVHLLLDVAEGIPGEKFGA